MRVTRPGTMQSWLAASTIASSGSPFPIGLGCYTNNKIKPNNERSIEVDGAMEGASFNCSVPLGWKWHNQSKGLWDMRKTSE
ncbi:unnamed protein product [Linum trigynum]|uniref:Uncharacterized protein n=1 Tax=Linum trigynum TaxID=586398 RepID=A0AAV2C945_9ROSI